MLLDNALIMRVKNRVCSLHYCLLIVVLFLPFNLFSQKVRETKRQRICLIDSYNSNFPTYIHSAKAIQEFIDTTHYHIDVEFMNSKEFVDDVYVQHFHDFLSYKLSKRKPYDLFLVADDYALEYVLKYEQDLFKGKPIVFWGINNIDLARKQNANAHCTGVVEDISIKETINLAKTLNPKLEEMYVISDNSESGKTDLNRVLNLKGYNTAINVHELNLAELSFSEFETNLKKLKGEKALLLLSLYRDKDFKYKPFYEGLDFIKKNSDLPIYHLWKHGLNEGIVGGFLIHHYRQTQEALKIADQILKGKAIEEIPVLEESPNQCYLDYKELKKAKLVPSTFPSDWIVINKPSSFIQMSRKYAYLILSVGLLVFGLLFFFIYYAKRENLLKNELIQAQLDASKVDELKNAFLNNISHEIRTPMNGILGFAEFLASPDVSMEDRVSYLDIISENSNQLLNVVNEIVDIAKVQSGHSDIKMELIDIDGLLSDMEREYKKIADQKNLEIRLIKNISVKKVCADRLYLQKIFRNLIDNAIKFTDDGCVEIGYDKKGDLIEFYVKDTGIGISEDLFKTIFENFRQVQESDIREYGGLGLGLSITRAFVKSMGGKVWVESVENVGSCFYFTLPYVDYDPALLINPNVFCEVN